MKNTTLCYLERDNSYLLLHRIKKKNDVNQDKWVGIGGKFQDRESPEDCLLREAKEETGLVLDHYVYCGIVTFISDRFPTEWMHLFYSDSFHGELKDCDEGVLEWVPKEKMKELNLWEGDYIFLELMEQKAPFFSLKLCYEGDLLTKAVLNGKRIR